MLTPEVENPVGEETEIADLARRLGEPERWTRAYAVKRAADVEWVRGMQKRRGEVILIVPRPGGKVILHTKRFYPNGVYRLPSGGIRRGEAADDAARRETFEEMGFEIGLTRFVGVVDNIFELDAARLAYPSFIFQTAPTTAPPRVMDAAEAITAFREVNISELRAVARALRVLPPAWALWGRFRAAPHELVGKVKRET